MSSSLMIPKTVGPELHFIHGHRINPSASQQFEVIQPRSGEVLTKCAIADEKLVNMVVKDARKAQLEWAKVGAQGRGTVLRDAAALIRELADELAYLESLDSGKTIQDSKIAMMMTADCFEFFAGTAQDLAGSFIPLDNDWYAYTQKVPWGVVGAIGVWNYPMLIASWKIAPALMCGNAVVYKPSELAPVSGAFLAQILHHAGLPAGVFSVIQGCGETGRLICEHKGIDKVTFTGSTATGAKVLGSCCKDGHMKQTTLELGGKSSCIICPDADLDTAVTGAIICNFMNQGAVCANSSKVLVHESMMEEFRKKVIETAGKIVVGDPLDEATSCGATISREHLNKVKGFVEEAKAQGAKILYGGTEVKVDNLPGGFYFSPTIIENVNEDMRIWKEEIFGPVMLLMPYSSIEDAITMANNTPYGLAAGLFTRDLHRGYTIASRLQAGIVWVNAYNYMSPMVPFGGTKQSGFGRENGLAALDTFSQIKSVVVNASNELENFLVH